MSSFAQPTPPTTNRKHQLLGESLGKLYEKRVQHNQDLIVLVDDQHNRRGTGKTVLSILLAQVMDRTDDGLTPEKAHINPEGLIGAYREQPKGSGLVLDEAEVGMDKYRASSASNVALRRLVSMGRVREKYVIMNVPNSGQVDRDLKALADVWIMVQNKGKALVHFMGYQPYSQKPLSKKRHNIHWRDVSDDRLNDVYQKLADEKDQYLDGQTEDSMYITPKEHEKQIKQAKTESEREARDEHIRKIYKNTDLSQRRISDVLGISSDTVNKAVNA